MCLVGILLLVTFVLEVIVGLLLLSVSCFRFPVVKVPVRPIDGAQAILGASSVAVPPSPTIGNLSQAHWWMLRAMSLEIVNWWLSRFRLA